MIRFDYFEVLDIKRALQLQKDEIQKTGLINPEYLDKLIEHIDRAIKSTNKNNDSRNIVYELNNNTIDEK